jgi:hypothetical protein
MKNILILFGILFLTTISVNGQDSFTKISFEEKIGDNRDIDSTELYDSIYKDFESFFIKETIKEEIQDLEMDSLYSDIYQQQKITQEVIDEKKEDNIFEEIYLQILNLVKN